MHACTYRNALKSTAAYPTAFTAASPRIRKSRVDGTAAVPHRPRPITPQFTNSLAPRLFDIDILTRAPVTTLRQSTGKHFGSDSICEIASRESLAISPERKRYFVCRGEKYIRLARTILFFGEEGSLRFVHFNIRDKQCVCVEFGGDLAIRGVL